MWCSCEWVLSSELCNMLQPDVQAGSVHGHQGRTVACEHQTSEGVALKQQHGVVAFAAHAVTMRLGLHVRLGLQLGNAAWLHGFPATMALSLMAFLSDTAGLMRSTCWWALGQWAVGVVAVAAWISPTSSSQPWRAASSRRVGRPGAQGRWQHGWVVLRWCSGCLTCLFDMLAPVGVRFLASTAGCWLLAMHSRVGV